MFKFKNIGAFSVAHNIPYCTVPIGITLKNGYAVTYDEVAKTIALPTADTAKAKGLAVVYNEMDKAFNKDGTYANNENYTIVAGEYPRLIELRSIESHIVMLDSTVIVTDYSTLAVGDTLVADVDGRWVKGDVTGYAEYLEITALVSYGTKGLEAKVCVA